MEEQFYCIELMIPKRVILRNLDASLPNRCWNTDRHTYIRQTTQYVIWLHLHLCPSHINICAETWKHNWGKIILNFFNLTIIFQPNF